jgi:hypothetical protein
MLRYLKGLLILFVFILVFIFGVYLFGCFLSDFFVKIKLHKHFKIDDVAFAVLILSALLTYFSIKVGRWFFKRLQEQKD